ncbi:Protein kinase domain [Trinorchestia longiramus]|nr:Protein kinase domain [Trinorchestia longiramus]
MVYVHASDNNATSRQREEQIRSSATSPSFDSESNETLREAAAPTSACGNLPEGVDVHSCLDESGGLTSTPLTFAASGSSADLRCLLKNTNLPRVNKILSEIPLPPVNKVRKNRRKYRAGDYLLGPYLGSSPVNSVIQCLARKIGTDEFYTMKILTIYDEEDETQDDRQGKMLLHTEHSLLSILKDTPGVIKMHALFQDYALDCVRRCAQMRPSHVSAAQRVRKRQQQQQLIRQRALSSRVLRSFNSVPPTSRVPAVPQSAEEIETSSASSSRSTSAPATTEGSGFSHDETSASGGTPSLASAVGVNEASSTAAGNVASAASNNETSESADFRISFSNTDDAPDSIYVENSSYAAVDNPTSTGTSVSVSPATSTLTGSAALFSFRSASNSSASDVPRTSLIAGIANAPSSGQPADTAAPDPDVPQVTASSSSHSNATYNSTTFTFIAPTAVPTTTSTVNSVFALPPPPPPPPIRSSSNFTAARSSMQSFRQLSFGLSRGRYLPAPFRQAGRRLHQRRLLGTDSYWLRTRDVARHRRLLDESRRSRGSSSSIPPSYRSPIMRDTMDGRRFGGRSFGSGHSARFGPSDDWLYDATDISDPRDLECLFTGRIVRRLCLVLDCVTPHEFSEKTDHLTNLQHYVIARQALHEVEALTILYHTAVVVHSIHEKNIVHRDLKLGNLVVERGSGRVILTNLCLGQYLMPGMPKLQDQRGSPAYISPDVLSAQPYRGKPSDMWSLGVVLFTMLYGHFPFYDKVPHELFKKIKAAKYIIPRSESVKEDTVELIHSLLEVDPASRYTSGQLIARLAAIIPARLALESRRVSPCKFQVVPNMDDRLKEALKRRASPPGPINLVSPDATPSFSMVPMSGSNFFPFSGSSLSSDAVSASSTSASGSSNHLSSSLSSPFDRDRPPQRLHQQLQQLQIITPNRLLLSTSPNPDEIQVVPEVHIAALTSCPSVSSGVISVTGQNTSSNLSSSLSSNAFLPSLFSVNSSRGSGFTPLFNNPRTNLLLDGELSVAVSTSAPAYQAVPSAEIRVSSSDFIVPVTLSVSALDQSLYPISFAESNPSLTNSSPSTTESSSIQLDSPLSEGLSLPTFSFAPVVATSLLAGGSSAQSSAAVTPAVLPPGGLRWSSPCCSESTSTVAARTSPSTSAQVQEPAVAHADATDAHFSDLDALIHAMKQERQIRGNNSSSKDYFDGGREPTLPHMAPLSTATRAGTSLIPHSYGELTPLTPEQLLALRDLLPPLPEFGSSARPRSAVSGNQAVSGNGSSLLSVSAADALNSNPFWQRLGLSRLMPPVRTSALAHPWAPWPSRPTSEGLSRLVLSRQQLQQNNDLANLSLTLSPASTTPSLVVTSSAIGITSSIVTSPSAVVTSSQASTENSSTISSVSAFTGSVNAQAEGRSDSESTRHQTATNSSSREIETSSGIVSAASPSFTLSLTSTNANTTTTMWLSSTSSTSSSSVTPNSSSGSNSMSSSNMISVTTSRILDTSTSSYRTAARSSSRRRARARRTESATPYHINLRPRRRSVFPSETSRHRSRTTRSTASARVPPRVILSSDDDSMEEMSPPPSNRSESAPTRTALVEDASSSSGSE